MPSGFIKTHGCQMNGRDSEAGADVVLLNTGSVSPPFPDAWVN